MYLGTFNPYINTLISLQNMHECVLLCVNQWQCLPAISRAEEESTEIPCRQKRYCTVLQHLLHNEGSVDDLNQHQHAHVVY